MTVITEMREAAAGLPDSPVKKMLIWAELELGERADRIFELEEDETALYKEIDGLRLELHRVKGMLQGMASGIAIALVEMPAPAVDLAPYAKTKRTKKVNP